MTTGQACQVVRAVREMIVMYSLREILRSIIYLGKNLIATFNMTL